MRISLARPKVSGVAVPTLLIISALVFMPNAAIAQRGSTKTLSGQILPLLPMPPGIQPAGVALRWREAVCNPRQPLGGPGPSAFYDAKAPWPQFAWEAVPGTVAYQVERAVDGTSNWVMAGSTCSSPYAMREDVTTGKTLIVFQDIAGGLVPNVTYVYKVTAIGAAGEVGWNSVRWSQQSVVEPRFHAINTLGSTMTLTLALYVAAVGTLPTTTACIGSLPMEITITAAYGLSRVVPLGNGCSPLPQILVYGVPVGTHTLTARVNWIQSLDAAMPRVMWSTSKDTVIVIKP